jgi:uncharacterized protein YutD
MEFLENNEITKLEGKINTLSIDMDGVIEESYNNTWLIDRSFRKKLNVPIIENASSNSTFDLFYFLGFLEDKIENYSLKVQPDRLILSTSSRVPMYKINHQRVYNHSLPSSSNFFRKEIVYPGTFLTEFLDGNLKIWLPSGQYPAYGKAQRLLPGEIVYYHYNYAGESKLKLLDSQFTSENGSNIFYGNVNKFVILLLLNDVPSAFVTNDEFKTFVDIEKLKEDLINNGINPKDYAILMTLFNNKYIPVNFSFESVFDIYKNTTKDDTPFLVLENGILNWKNLLLIINNLPREEVDRNIYYNNIFNPRGTNDLIQTFTGKSYNPTWDETDVQQLVKDYLTYWGWFVAYYSKQKINWKFFYSPIKAPLLSDIINFWETQTSPFCDKGCNYHIIDQLVASIDLRSLFLIPPNFLDLIKEGGVLSDLYPYQFHSIDGIPLLPPINIDRISAATKNLIVKGSWEEFDIPTIWKFNFKQNKKPKFAKSNLN